MPQDNQTPETPGSDVLLDTLRRSRITDDQRQQIWDAYHTKGQENDFVGALNKLDIKDDVKQTLYDMRYKGFKNLGNQQAQQSSAVADLDTHEEAKGDVRPSVHSLMRSQIVDPAVTVGQQTLKGITDIPQVFKPGFSPEELQKGKELISALPFTSGQEPPPGAAYAGAALRRVGRLGGDILSTVSSPFNLATASISQHIQNVVQPWQDLAMRMFGKDAHLDSNTGRYTTGNEDVDKTIDNAVGAIPFLMVGDATHKTPTPFDVDIERMRNVPRAARTADPNLNTRVREASTRSLTTTPMGPTSETGGQQLQLDFTSKAPTEAHAPMDTESASKVASAPTREEALIAPKPTDYVGKEPPVPLYRFPKAAIEGMPRGETIGLGRVDLIKPVELEQGFPLPKAKAAQQEIVENVVKAGELHKALDSYPNPTHVHILEDATGLNLTGKTGGEILNQLAKVNYDVPGLEQAYQQGYQLSRAEETARRSLLVPKSEGIKAAIPAQSENFIDTFRSNIDKLADLSHQADLAENDSHANELNKQREQLENQTMDALRQQSIGPQHVAAFTDAATRLEAQAKAIREKTEDTIKQRGMKEEIADLRRPGGPIRQGIDPETGRPAAFKPETPVKRVMRSVYDELQGKVPTSEFDDIEVNTKPEGIGDEEWEKYITGLKEERINLKRKISDAVVAASNSGISLEALREAGLKEHEDELVRISGLLGKYTQEPKVGANPYLKPELDEKGAIKPRAVLNFWTLAEANLALGKNLRNIPTDEEFFQHADMLQEKGRLLRKAAEVARKAISDRKQAGVIGEGPLRGKVQPVSLKDMVPEDKELMKRANAAKIYARTIDEKFPMSIAGFLSKDGKIGIDTGRMTHADTAATLLPEIVKSGRGSALRAMLEKEWIAKHSPVDYESWNLDRQAFKTIEKDLNEGGKYGQAIRLDTRHPVSGRMTSIELPSGWDEKYHDLQAAVTSTVAKQGWGLEHGAIRGTTLAATSTAGAVAGAVVGAHIGGPIGGLIGGAIGWGAGFMSPALASRASLMFSHFNALRPGLSTVGISMRDWMMGPKQLDPINPDMKTILDAQQRDIKGPTKSLLTRVAQLPANVTAKMFDKFVFISDRPSAIGKFLMQFDERGRAFRDLRGKIDVDNSPYVSAWLAAGGGGGMAEAHLLDYKRMYSEAQSKGLVNNLNEYLNLKGYQRVYDVMQERIAEHDQNIQKMQQALQQPNLPVEVEAGIKKALRESKADRQDVIDKLTSKTLVPAPYDPPKIASDLQNIQATLGPKFNDVQALADKVFALNRKVLDMTHDAGIVGDADYQKYTSRGDEYIPMHRILEQMSENTARISGKGSPLYLRQQNVIKALMGSDRVNRDPIIASADANHEAIREVIRNGVIKDYLKVAAADPEGVGSIFKPVRSGYKAQPGEGIVGVYEGGVQHSFATPSWLSESLKNVSPSSLDMIGKGPLSYFGQLLRKGATMGNLAWSIPNALRHFGDMAIMSDAGLKDIRTLPKDARGLVKEWMNSVYSSINHDGRYQEYLRSGAAYSTLQRMITPEAALDLTTLGFRQKIAHGRLIDVVQDFNAAVEDTTKMTTFNRLRQAGYTEKAAAWETRRYGGGPDFAKQGTLTPAIGLVSMFFNAHLQYVSRVFARAAENPARVAVALGAITAMAMAANEHNMQQKDEKGNLLMRKVPFTDRENNFVVLSGETYQSSTGATLPVYYKIPKPSFVKFLYNPIENMLNKVAGHEERSGTQLGLQALGNLSPGQMDLQESELGKSAVRGVVSSFNPLARAPLEELMNYKTTGVGAPIIPGREANIDPRFQYSPGTSEMAKRIGEGGVRGAVAGGAEGASIGYLLAGPKGAAVGGGIGSITGSFGISPRRAEHIIDTTTAGVGRIATGFVDPFLGGVNQTKMEGPEKLAHQPVAGPILGRFVSTSIDQQEQTLTQDFYRNAQAAQEPLNTLKFLEKNHPEQISAYVQSHKSDLWKGQVATMMQNRLGQITNAQKMVEQNTSMPEKDRAQALKNLHDVKLQVLNVFTKVMRPSPQIGQAAAMPGQGQGAPR